MKKMDIKSYSLLHVTRCKCFDFKIRNWAGDYVITGTVDKVVEAITYSQFAVGFLEPHQVVVIAKH